MDNNEQNWIDKYRAATANAKPEDGSFNNFVRRVAMAVGRALGRTHNKNRATLLTIQSSSAIPSAEVVKEDDAA